MNLFIQPFVIFFQRCIIIVGIIYRLQFMYTRA